jgi:FAD/FMN-containing dehydrogenase
MKTLSPDILKELKSAAGDGGWIEDAKSKAPYLSDERNLFHGQADIILKPDSTPAIAKIVKICSQKRIGIVPQGGNTGYCGGSIPNSDGSEIIISLARLNRIRELDVPNNTMTVEAGCILSDIQTKAEDADKLFPLSLGAEGSCQIGGNLATNAGGIQVLRYGNARDMVLGLEVVLPNGQIFDGLKTLRKNNTGYDLKQLFLGAEGTLGIITAASLKLYPRPNQKITAIVALDNSKNAVALLSKLQCEAEGSVTSFEIFNRSCLDLVLKHINGVRDPFPDPYKTYVLVEIMAMQPNQDIRTSLELQLANVLGAKGLLDAVIASSGTQSDAFWRLRETIPEAQNRAGGCIKHDISVPISKVSEFIDHATKHAKKSIKDVRVIAFGHIGDGNIHFNLTQPTEKSADEFLAHTDNLCSEIHDIAMNLGGSFSAEHGIGILKKPELERYKSAVEKDLMALIKDTIDPKNIMNPGKVVTPKN